MQVQLQQRINQALADKLFPGCVIGIVQANGERLVLAAGQHTYDVNATPMQAGSIFDVASVTKAIPTAALALQLIDQGKLQLTDQLIRYVPEFNNAQREQVLIKHLLSQTLHVNLRLSEHATKIPAEILRNIFTTEFLSAPGTTFYYTNTTSILLGLVIERILGESLDVLSAKHFFEPLHMSHTSFHPLRHFPLSQIVPTEWQPWRGGLVHGSVHDDSAYTLSQQQVVGSAGLFSTAPDLLNFLEMLLHQGSIHGRQYFSANLVEQMHTNQLADIGKTSGLGWELNQSQYMGQSATATTFGKTGFTGCVVMGDVPRGIGLVILSNYTYPSRPPTTEHINQFRHDIADLVWQLV